MDLWDGLCKNNMYTLAFWTLLQTANKLSCCPRIIDISKRKPGTEPVSMVTNPQQQLVKSTANLALLEKKTQEVWGCDRECKCIGFNAWWTWDIYSYLLIVNFLKIHSFPKMHTVFTFLNAAFSSRKLKTGPCTN